MWRQWKTCMYKRAITRACKSRNYNASRSERSCCYSFSSLPFPFEAFRMRNVKGSCVMSCGRESPQDSAMRQNFFPTRTATLSSFFALVYRRAITRAPRYVIALIIFSRTNSNWKAGSSLMRLPCTFRIIYFFIFRPVILESNKLKNASKP